MDIIKKLLAMGIQENGAADIFLSSKKQFQLINDLEIDLRNDKDHQYRCVIVPNNGSEVFSSPVVGHSSGSMLGGMSLQVGIFTLLAFRRLVPLLPVFKDADDNRLVIGLYSVSEALFDLQSLVRLYKVERVFEDFQKMQERHRATQPGFLEEYERKKAISRKLAGKDQNDHTETSIPGIIMEEVMDEALIEQISSTLEMQKVQYQKAGSLDPWAGSSEADQVDKTDLKFK